MTADIRSAERALVAAGLTRRQARAVLHGGWRALAGEVAAEAAELRLELDALRALVQYETIESSAPDA